MYVFTTRKDMWKELYFSLCSKGAKSLREKCDFLKCKTTTIRRLFKKASDAERGKAEEDLARF